MNVEVFIISRYDEKERPYVSTTCPTQERIDALKIAGYQIHMASIVVLSVSDYLKRADDEGSAHQL